MRPSAREMEGHACPAHMQKRGFYGTYYNVGVFSDLFLERRQNPTENHTSRCF